MRRARASVVVAGLLTATAAALAQQQPASPPVFRAGADVVAVDAVVHDKSGHFVFDLKPEDFELREDGKPQPIDHVYIVRDGAAAAVPSQNQPAGEEPLAPPAPAQRIFIVVFDSDHLSPGGFKRVQAAASALFTKEFKSGDVGGVVTDRQMANKRLTSNREELVADVNDAKPAGKTASDATELRQWPTMNDAEALQIAKLGLRDDPVLEEVVRRACADDPEACNTKGLPVDVVAYAKAQRVANEAIASSNRTLTTLAALTNGLARIEGRKTILLLSEGFVADESWPAVQQAVGAAARANARIYTLDARGLDKNADLIHRLAPNNDTLGNLLASFDIGADSVNSLAVDTGGFAVKNTNIFDEAVGEIASEAGTYYVLGYRSAIAPDNKFHKISVTVKRPAVTVRARRGFVATARPLPTLTEAAATEKAAPSTPAPGTPAPSPSGPSTPALSASPRKNAVENVASLVEKDAPAASTNNAIVATPAHDAQAEASAGWDAYRRGDLDTARTDLSAAAANPSARPWVHYALGQTTYALRDFRAAVAQWEHVRTATPEFEPVYFDLVDGYLQIHEPDRAIRVLRTAAGRWPQDHEVFSALGVVQVSRGVLDDAVRSFQHAIALAPADATGYFNLGKALEIRYAKSRRFVQQTRTWVWRETDRRDAIANYEEYLKRGGPLENEARDGLERLSWAMK